MKTTIHFASAAWLNPGDRLQGPYPGPHWRVLSIDGDLVTVTPWRWYHERRARKALSLAGMALGLAALVVAALLFGGCGINPMEGNYGPVKYVPEVDSCWVSRRVTPTRQEVVRGLCEGGGHDVKVFGTRYW